MIWATRLALEAVLNKGFSRKIVPLRRFEIELKFRPDGDDGTNEILVLTTHIDIPSLKNADMERQWCFALCWDKLYGEWKELGVNQCFVFTKDFGEILARLESQEFQDEPMKKLPAPSQRHWDNWFDGVKKRFKRLYGFDLTT